MKQTNLKWMKSNLYNAEMLTHLIQRVQQATEQTGLIYRGWVSDIVLEDGVIAETGIVSDADDGLGFPFTYTAAELQVELDRIVLFGTRRASIVAPKPGTLVMATTKGEMHARGDIGVVDEGKTPYWPEVFPVRWDNSKQISYLGVEEYTTIVMER